MVIESRDLLRFDTGIERIIDRDKETDIRSLATHGEVLPELIEDDDGIQRFFLPKSIEGSLLKELSPGADSLTPSDQVHFNALFQRSASMLKQELESRDHNSHEQKILMEAVNLLEGEQHMVNQLTLMRKILLRI